MNNTFDHTWKKLLFTMAGALAIGLASCAQPSAPTTNNAEAAQPASVQAANSETAADMTAAAVGTESGGAGMVFLDALTLAEGGRIDGAIIKGQVPLSDSTLHTVTVTRTRSNGKVSYSGTWTHTWAYLDVNGDTMPRFIKGQTDKIVITSYGQHSLTNPRISTDDSSRGSWTISGLVAHPDSATLNGSLTRFGDRTRLKNGSTMSHLFTVDFTNDVLVKGLDRDNDDTVAYLLGNASSDFKVTNFNGRSFERQTAIVFHGDGTATLTITRTSANGTVDTITIDVRKGIWLRDDHIG
ncbi:MAG: hypothetical protein Q8922_05565 [Bacteroidota bacterium]|nr:hypothetical protein [Bacteroidota bacterium]MDP4233129.1 hypothetical protein [Bacteroidota bacterium]MDP4241726.1 hypothetical protein [Bacteroidota bacterium]MDP4287384.1 hypothetical protein [Bacteroidota bacterium]